MTHCKKLSTQAMKHAGVAITVTSFTDAAAFFIGASTVGFSFQNFFFKSNSQLFNADYVQNQQFSVQLLFIQSMPILRAFCFFAGTGVIFLYIFACSYFVACLVLDERRRYSWCCCQCPCIEDKETNNRENMEN